MPHSQSTPKPLVQVTTDEFPLEELSKYRGHWVALSPDGRRLIGSSAELATLERLVREAGEDPQEVLLEQIPDGDFIASGLELS